MKGKRNMIGIKMLDILNKMGQYQKLLKQMDMDVQMIIQFFDFLYSYNKNKILKPNKIKYNELSKTDVIIINDYVYQIMKKHKNFKLLIKNNLFNKICEFHTNSKN